MGSGPGIVVTYATSAVRREVVPHHAGSHPSEREERIRSRSWCDALVDALGDEEPLASRQ
jgi:hypothetical protein